MHREGERLDTGEESEDSDYECSPEQASGPTPEAEDGKKKEGRGSLPVLTTGSFVRYGRRR